MFELRGEIAGDVTGDVPDVFWHGLMYERLITLFAGPSGVGKSGITVRMVADLTAAGKFVIYCPEEDPVMLKFRLEAAGADLKKILIAQYRLPKDLEALEFAIRKLGASLVVFDTAQKHITTPMQRWDEPLDLLDEMLHRTNCAAAIIHHVNKNARKGDDWRATISGSTAGLTGSSRMIHLVGKHETDGRLICCTVKNAYARGNAEGIGIAFDWNEEQVMSSTGDPVDVGYITAGEKNIKIDNPTALVVIKGDGEKKGPTPEQLLAAMEFLTLALADGPACMGDRAVCTVGCGSFAIKHSGCPDCGAPTREVLGLKLKAEDAGISNMTLKRAREELEIVGSRKMSHLPEDKGGQGSIPWMRLPMKGDIDSEGNVLSADHPNLKPGAPSELH